MLSCREVAERASEFLDATAPWRFRLQIRMHLLMCGLCREYVRQLGLIVRTLRRLPREDPPEVVKRQVVEVFRAERP